MRRTFLFLLLVAGISFMPSVTWSQGKKGFGGGPVFDPDESFNRLSGGKDVIVISELDPQKQNWVRMMAQRNNLSGDRITRAQYKVAMENFASMFKKGPDGGGGIRLGGGPGGPGSGLGGPGGNPPPPPPAPMGNSPSANAPQSKDGGRDRDAEIDSRAERIFRDRDKDNDGFLRFEEMSESLQNERDTYDTNKDGFIDLAEFKAYMRVRMARRDNPPDKDKPANNDEKKSTDNNAPVAPDSRQSYKEDPRPQIFRAGKLPTKDLPEWFIRLDKEGDNDGQVGLYEWKTLGKSVDEFMAMDLNGDGLLTAEEYLRWKATAKKTESSDQVASTEGGENSSQDRRDRRQGPQGNDNGGRRGPGGDNAAPRFGGGFGPPMGGDGNGGGFGGGRFGPPRGDGNGGGRFGPPRGDGNGGGRFGPPKGGDGNGGGNNGGGPFRKKN